MAEKARLNLRVIDLRTSEHYEVFGLQCNEDGEVVNWQSVDDIDGRVGGGNWQEFSSEYHRLYGGGGYGR